MKFGGRVVGSFATQIIVLACGLISTVVIARAVGASGNGAYAVSLQAGGLAVLIGGLGIDVAVIYHAGRERRPSRDLPATLLGFGFPWGVAVAAMALALVSTLAAPAVRGIDRRALVISIGLVPVLLATRYLRGYLLGRNRILDYNAVNSVVAVVSVLLVTAAVVVLHDGVLGAIAAYAIANLIGLAIVIRLVPESLGAARVGFVRSVVKDLISFGLRAQLSNVLQFFSYRLDLFLVNAFLGIADAGLYAVATLMAEAVWYIPNSVALVLTPRIAASEREDREVFASLICRTTVAISAGATALAAVAAPAFVWVVLGPSFLGSLVPFYLLLPGVFVLALDKPIASYQLGRGRPQISLYVTLASAPLTLVAYALLIPRYGLIGAAAGSTLSYIGTTAVEIIFLHRTSSLRLYHLLLPTANDRVLYRRIISSALDRLHRRRVVAAEGTGG